MRCFSYQLLLFLKMPCKMLSKDYLGCPVHHFRRLMSTTRNELLLALFLCFFTYHIVSPFSTINTSTQELYHVFCKIFARILCQHCFSCTVCICFIGTSEINKVLEDLFTLTVWFLCFCLPPNILFSLLEWFVLLSSPPPQSLLAGFFSEDLRSDFLLYVFCFVLL